MGSKSTGARLRLIEYAAAEACPISGVLWGRDNEGTLRLPYCFALIETAESTILVDSGYDLTPFGAQMSRGIGIDYYARPIEVLERLGVPGERVDAIVYTHSHFDHMGSIDAFPSAHVYVQGRELEKYREYSSLAPELSWLRHGTDPASIDVLERALVDGRVTLLTEERTEILPGVIAVAAHDTHTAGSQYVLVNVDGIDHAVAGDCVYVYENVGGFDGADPFVPIGLIAGSAERSLRVMHGMLAEVEGERRRIIPLHENRVFDIFRTHVHEDGVRVAEIVPTDKTIEPHQ